MNPFNDVRDEEFVPFLNTLGVETYNKSFEWMLNDPDFSGVLLWLYNNLDQNNALTAREEYRYAEIQKKGVLPPEELTASISSILDEYPGIPLPGDQEAMEDVTMEIRMFNERLNFLENQESVYEDLVQQNEITKEDLNCEVTKLNGMLVQCKDDGSTLAEECLLLSKEIETITRGTIDVVAERLTLYNNAHLDKQHSQSFFVNGPLEAYHQAQAMFRSHFELFLSKRFSCSEDFAREAELREALAEAKVLERRLSKAISSLFESRAQHEGSRAIMTLLGQYSDPHPTQYESASFEARNSIALLEQQNSILDQQIEAEVERFSERRTEMSLDAALKYALSVRESRHADLTFLHDVTRTALSLDSCLYYLLRSELKTTMELVQFADHLRQCVQEDAAAVLERIESMDAICSEQKRRLDKLKMEDSILLILSSMFNVPYNNVNTLVKLNGDLQHELKDLKDIVEDLFRDREERLKEFKRTQRPLISYIWDGCTKQPNCRDRAVSALTHTLTRDIDVTGKMVTEASGLFTAVKNGDKQQLRKLWQWFLTDQARLHALMKETASKSYS